MKGVNVQTSISIVLSFFGLAMFILSPFSGIFIDKFSSRKWPLIIGLISQMMAIFLIAVSTNGKTNLGRLLNIACVNVLMLLHSVVSLSFSRIFQGAAASLLWVASMATITDTVGSGDMGKTMGIIGPIITTGAFLGPMIGGLLLSSVGYWRTWLMAVAMVALDLILRLTMIDKPKLSITANKADTKIFNEVEINTESGMRSPNKHSPVSNTKTIPSSSATESTPLLATRNHSSSLLAPTKPLSTAGSFLFILQQRRIISSIVFTVIFLSAFNSFNTTLALHVQELYHWGPREVGFLYLALTGPSVLLGPFAGWLRDRIGVRWPTLIGTGLAAPLYVVVGLIGDKRFSWTQGELGKGILIGALILMGCALELTSGTCLVEGIRMTFSSFLLVKS